jgi:CheY-like chemotaxis protein
VPRIRLIHWNASEGRARAALLRAQGYTVQFTIPDGTIFRQITARLPDLVVIDLSRIPSHGRDVALVLRSGKATRSIPLVFLDGDPDKVSRIKHLLPDAGYGSWVRSAGLLKRAMASPPSDPVKPASNLAGYSATPLPRKLGIGPDTVLALLGAPRGFERVLGELPSGARLRRGGRGVSHLALWFVRNRRELESKMARVRRQRWSKGLWIAWPKQTSPLATDVSETAVRRAAMAHGLVDYKVCAIDSDWSALKFARRD